MKRRILILLALCCAAGYSTIIDRIAVVVGNRVIKQSEIVREIRITSFLNGDQPDLSPASRKQAAGRPIDQYLIRQEVQTGEYPGASSNEAAQLLLKIRNERYGNDGQYRQALAHYGVTEEELRDQLTWHLTVLRFIDARFRPAVIVTSSDVEEYYRSHRAALERANPRGPGFEQLRPQIEETIIGDRINQQFEAWLEMRRQRTKLEYRMEELR